MTAIETLKMNGLYTDVIGIVNDYTNGDKKYWREMGVPVLMEIKMYNNQTKQLRFNPIYRYVDKQVDKALLELEDNPEDRWDLSRLSEEEIKDRRELIKKYSLFNYWDTDKYSQENIDKMNRLYPDLPKCDMKRLRRLIGQYHQYGGLSGGVDNLNDTELLLEYINFTVQFEWSWYGI